MLYNQIPSELPPDQSNLKTLHYLSRADDSEQQADLYLPHEYGTRPLPLVLAPHPITWTAKEDYHGGYEGISTGYHPGWYSLADKYRIGLVMPHGHHRRVENCSLASPEQISDMVQLISEVEGIGISVDHQRIYTCGLSMGGQEALVMAGVHPEIIAAVVAFNPIIDLAVWQNSLATSKIEEIRAFGTDERIVLEVGAEPEKTPALYNERSPINYSDSLVNVPILLFWSEKDLIVPEQESKHSYRLYQMIKKISKTAPVAEFNHTLCHGVIEFNQMECWQLHEWCDYDLALKWLLSISKPI